MASPMSFILDVVNHSGNKWSCGPGNGSKSVAFKCGGELKKLVGEVFGQF